MAHRTSSCLFLTAHSAASRKYPSEFSVLDATTVQTLEHRQIRKHPSYKDVWDQSYSNEIRRLCQGVGFNPIKTDQCIKGTNTFKVILYKNIPQDRCKEITYSKVVCLVRSEKADPNRTCITISSNHICYPDDVGTKTASLDIVKLVINSVLS